MAGRLYGKCSQVAKAWARCNWLQRSISRYQREWGGGAVFTNTNTLFYVWKLFFEVIHFPTKQAHFMQVSVRKIPELQKRKIWGTNKDLKMQTHILLRCKSWPSLTTTHPCPPSDRLHWPGTIPRGRLWGRLPVCNAIRSLFSLCIIAWLTRHDS